MRNLGRRLTELEKIANPASERWHRVMVDVGQDEDEAFAAYETAHGPIGNDNVFIVQFVKPGALPA